MVNFLDCINTTTRQVWTDEKTNRQVKLNKIEVTFGRRSGGEVARRSTVADVGVGHDAGAVGAALRQIGQRQRRDVAVRGAGHVGGDLDDERLRLSKIKQEP